MTFDVVYLDTEVLYRNSWPSRSLEFEVFLELAKAVSLSVVIPESAEMERQRQWIEEIEEESRALSDAHESLSASCKRWNLPEPIFASSLDIPSLEKHFVALSTGMKERWGIQSAPVASTPLRSVYEMALHRRGAFEEKDGLLVGLQDTVIFLSVVEHLKTLTGARGAFVSRDRIFKKPGIEDLVKTENATIQVVPSLAELIGILRQEIGPDRVWEVDMKEATATLNVQRNRLQKLLLHPVRLLGLSGGEVEGVVVHDLRNVQTPPIGGRNPGSRRVLSFDSHLEVLLRDRKLYFSSPGSEPTGVHTIGKCVGLDAKVEVTAEWDGKVYTNLRDARIVAAALYQAV